MAAWKTVFLLGRGCARNPDDGGDIVRRTARTLVIFLLLCLGSDPEAFSRAPELGCVNAIMDAARSDGVPLGQALASVEGFTRTVAQASPAVENESQVVARVLRVEVLESSALNIAPPQLIDRIRLELLRVQDAPGKENRLAGREGTVFDAYSKERVDPALTGKEILGRVIFRGDERRGMFWIHGVVLFSEESNPR
jgi:hypothetical protein